MSLSGTAFRNAARLPAACPPLLLLLFAATLCALAGAVPAVSAAAPESALSRPGFPGEETLKVWIDLKDKGPGPGISAGPESGVRVRDSRAYEDLPVHAPYLDSLAAAGAKVLVALKWQNRVSARLPRSRLPRVLALACVSGARPFPPKARAPRLPPWTPWRPAIGASRPAAKTGTKTEAGAAGMAAWDPGYGASRALLDSLRISEVHGWMARRGMAPGRGVRLAVIDADFHLGHRAFRPLLERGGVKDQWDFVDGDATGADFSLGGSHGAECLSLIAARLPDTLAGVAPEADVLLYRAEDVSQERYIEEDFVAAAIERAVDSGAKVISISLGYRDGFTDGSPAYPYAWLDGRTRPSSLAAVGAARRDVVVVAAVGNANDDVAIAAPSLGAPADADSILAVGIVDRDRRRCSYSCTGPSADGRVKPDISSMGVEAGCQVFAVRPTQPDAIYAGAGTSFAAPVIAGLAVLLRQVRPWLSAEDVRQAILASGHRAGGPDSLVGYGLADAWTALHGPGSVPPAEGGRLAKAYHPGGRTPFSIAWVVGEGAREALVADALGRRIPVTLRNAGARLLLDPGRDLKTGVYFLRVKPAR